MRRIFVALSMAVALVLAGTDLGYAQKGHNWLSPLHIAQAREHASAAVEQGRMGHTDVLTQHAEQALEHVIQAITGMFQARAANEIIIPEHVQQAVKSLEEAINQGRMGHADVATKHAQEAVDLLSGPHGSGGGIFK
jgi:t-SNARE complex subunit (syntaxin)